MKSLNKHVPAIVFGIGLVLLIFSVHTFFNPGKSPEMTPIVNRALPEDAPATAPATRQALVPKPAPVIRFRPQPKPAAAADRINPREDARKAMQQPAVDYLKRVGLRMVIPQGYAFIEETDGPVQVLIGVSDQGRSEFFFFSAKGKYTADRANQYLKEYFSDEMKLTQRGKNQPFFSRGGFKDMTQSRGVNNHGLEYQAYFFTSAKASQSHLVVLMNRQLNRSPARVRELVDSISRAR